MNIDEWENSSEYQNQKRNKEIANTNEHLKELINKYTTKIMQANKAVYDEANVRHLEERINKIMLEKVKQAFFYGMLIESRPKDDRIGTTWIPCKNPNWNTDELEYRIKP